MTSLRTHTEGSPDGRELKELLSLLQELIPPTLYEQITRVLPKPGSKNGALLEVLKNIFGKVITENRSYNHFSERTRHFLGNR